MRKSVIAVSLLGALAASNTAMAAEEAAPAEPASPHTFTYNLGLYSQYIFRGLTQTDERPAIQGGVDYSHSSGFYVGTWASNISWLEDSGNYDGSSLEWDIYGGFRNTIGDTGIGYDIGLLNYIYPGSKTAAGAANPGFDDPYTLEAYGALSYGWFQVKLSYALTDDVFGVANADDTYYAEANANIPVGESGFTVNLHAGYQKSDGNVPGAAPGAPDNDDLYTYTDWKVGLTKSWSNGVNVGAYYTGTDAEDAGYTIKGDNIGDDHFTFFVQKTF